MQQYFVIKSEILAPKKYFKAEDTYRCSFREKKLKCDEYTCI